MCVHARMSRYRCGSLLWRAVCRRSRFSSRRSGVGVGVSYVCSLCPLCTGSLLSILAISLLSRFKILAIIRSPRHCTVTCVARLCAALLTVCCVFGRGLSSAWGLLCMGVCTVGSAVMPGMLMSPVVCSMCIWWCVVQCCAFVCGGVPRAVFAWGGRGWIFPGRGVRVLLSAGSWVAVQAFGCCLGEASLGCLPVACGVRWLVCARRL